MAAIREMIYLSHHLHTPPFGLIEKEGAATKGLQVTSCLLIRFRLATNSRPSSPLPILRLLQLTTLAVKCRHQRHVGAATGCASARRHVPSP